MGAQRQIDRVIGQIGQRAGDLFQRPDPAQIGQRRHQRDAAFRAAQCHGQIVGGQILEPGGFAGHDVIVFQRGQQPVGLTFHQPGQIGAAARRALDQPGKRFWRVGKQRARARPAFGVMRDRLSGDARCEFHRATIARRVAPSTHGL